VGKAKRNNEYDSIVSSTRKLAQSYGEIRQTFTGLNSSFRNSPLNPEATNISDATGTGKFVTVSLSANQTSNVASDDHVEFDTLETDGGIVLQTGSGQADGIFELESGKTYYLFGTIRPVFTGSSGGVNVSWYDITNSATLGKKAVYFAITGAGHNANQPSASVIVKPTTNITIELRTDGQAGTLSSITSAYTTATIFEIALGGSGSGSSGGGGSGGVTFPITPTINDHGNVGTVTEDIDIGASNGHVHKITLTGNPTLTFSNPPTSGTQIEFEIEFVQDGTGDRTVTHPASVAETVTISSTASSTTIVTYRTNDGGTTYHAIPALRGAISLSGSSTSATRELDNLTTTSINADLLPSSDDARDLGSASLEWKDLYIDGTANIDALSMGGKYCYGNQPNYRVRCHIT